MWSKTVTVEEALNYLYLRISESENLENRKLIESGGRILAENLTASIDQPPFTRSPLDGYALYAKETEGATPQNPVKLQVVGKVYAGEYLTGEVKQGQAVRIMTGAPIPKGCDTVIRQEDTDYGETEVCIYREQKAYENFCPEGEDFFKGEVLLKKGRKMNALELGIAASAGIETVKVKKKVLAAVITTGDELCIPGQQLHKGQIYDSNQFMIVQRLKELGAEPIFVSHVTDSKENLENQLKKAVKKADLIITTGGVSVGEKDFVKQVLEKIGAEIIFDRIKVKPGSPSVFSVWKGKPIFSLSGNPFGTIVHMELFVRTALSIMLGCKEIAAKEEDAFFQQTIEKKCPVPRYMRAVLKNGQVFLPDKKEKSGILSSINGCNCLLKMEAGKEKMEKGEKVCVVRI